MTTSVTESKTENAPQGAAPAAPEKHSMTARLGLAFALSFVGSKLALLGMAMDVGAMVGGKELSLWQRVRGVFDGTLIKNFQGSIIEKMMEAKNPIWESIKLTKYTNILLLGGGVVGGVLGWMRGGLIADAKDIYKHPWRSLKIVLGLEKPPIPEEQTAKTPPPLEAASGATQDAATPDASTRRAFTENVSARTSYAQAAVHEKMAQTHAVGA